MMNATSPRSVALLLLAAACTMMAGAAQAQFDDNLLVSGGGARAMTMGIMAAHEFQNAFDAKIPAESIFGLSGGAWAALAIEDYGQTPRGDLDEGQGALILADMKKEKKTLGGKFSALYGTHLDVWDTFEVWRDYVDGVMSTAGVSIDKLRKAGYTPRANVVVGARMVKTQRGFEELGLKVEWGDCTLVFGAQAGGNVAQLECPQKPAAKGEKSKVRTYIVDTLTGDLMMNSLRGVKDKVHKEGVELTADFAATVTSTAWLSGKQVGTGDTISGNMAYQESDRANSVGLPIRLKLKDSQTTISSTRIVSLFDQGIYCNYPITREMLYSDGMSVVIDASGIDTSGLKADSDELFAKYIAEVNRCEVYLRRNHGVYFKTLDPSKAPEQWMDQKIDVANAFAADGKRLHLVETCIHGGKCTNRKFLFVFYTKRQSKQVPLPVKQKQFGDKNQVSRSSLELAPIQPFEYVQVNQDDPFAGLETVYGFTYNPFLSFGIAEVGAPTKFEYDVVSSMVHDGGMGYRHFWQNLAAKKQ